MTEIPKYIDLKESSYNNDNFEVKDSINQMNVTDGLIDKIKNEVEPKLEKLATNLDKSQKEELLKKINGIIKTAMDNFDPSIWLFPEIEWFLNPVNIALDDNSKKNNTTILKNKNFMKASNDMLNAYENGDVKWYKTSYM